MQNGQPTCFDCRRHYTCLAKRSDTCKENKYEISNFVCGKSFYMVNITLLVLINELVTHEIWLRIWQNMPVMGCVGVVVVLLWFSSRAKLHWSYSSIALSLRYPMLFFSWGMRFIIILIRKNVYLRMPIFVNNVNDRYNSGHTTQ